MSKRKRDLLLDRLKNADADVRTRAADQVREQISPATRSALIDELLNQLSDKYEDVRWQAARALGHIGSARSDILDALTCRLDDDSKYVRCCAVEALGRIGSNLERVADHDGALPGGVLDELKSCLDDDCEKVRQVAKRALRATTRTNGAESAHSDDLGEGAGDAELCEGKVYEGEVKAIMDYGALVEIAPGRVGLLHVSQMDYSYVEDVANYCQVGDRLRVKLLEVEEDGKFRLTRRPLIGPNPWDGVHDEYDIGETVLGEVVSIENFGAFVDLKTGITGLVHISEMKDEYVDHPSEVVSIGHQVETEILEIDAEDERLRLRLKRPGPNNRSTHSPQSPQRRDEARPEKQRSDREVLLIDGSNVCRSWAAPNEDHTASLNVLLTLLLELVGQGYDFECIFDANIPHVLENQAESKAKVTYEQLENELSGRISRAPGGTDADDQLLQKADARGLRVVTNDRFRRKWDKDRREKYPWVTSNESQRLIKGCVNGKDLQVVSLDIFAEVRSNMRRMVTQLVEVTKEIGGGFSQDRGARSRGTLKFFDAEKGFGFIEPEDGNEDVFLHASNLGGTTSAKDLREGQEIAFTVEQAKKGPKALDASLLGQ